MKTLQNKIILTRYRKCGHNPAIGIHNIAGDGATGAHAVNGLPDEVVGSDQDWGQEANAGSSAIVKFEKWRIYIGFVTLITGFH